jgi:heptosyltransferase-1
MSRCLPTLQELERVLIVKLSSIGDVVHALPVSAALGDAFPHLQLTWIVEELAAPLVQGNPYVQEVIVLRNDWCARPFAPASWRRFASLRRELRARRFDLALDLQGLSRSALLAWYSGARYRFGYNFLRELAPLLVTGVPRGPQSIHVVDQLLDVVRFLGTPVPTVKFPLHIRPEDDASAVDLLAGVGIRADELFLALNPTDGGGYKGLGAERLSAVLRELQGDPASPVVLVGGTGDRELGEAIGRRVHPPPANLIGRTSLKQLAAILRRAALHVSGDTGSAHLAAALNTPVVCIFGRTKPARAAPYGPTTHVLHHPEQCAVQCRRYRARAPLNCDDRCRRPPPACLAAITVEEVVAAIRHCFGQTTRSSPSPVSA